MFFELNLLVFILGTCVGSFLNVCIYRLPAGESVAAPPSHCMGCGQKLGVLDLIPLVSYLMLGGKCRYCGVRVSAQYPLVELAAGLFFLGTFHYSDYTWQTPALWVLFSVLIAASVIDYKQRIIPNQLVIAGFLPGLPLLALQSREVLKSGILGFLAAGLFLFAIAVVSKGGMGGGDIKLGAVIGLYLGLGQVITALFLAFLTGGVVGLALILTGKKGRRDAVPFGPFLALGAILAAFWGEPLIRWYRGLWL